MMHASRRNERATIASGLPKAAVGSADRRGESQLVGQTSGRRGLALVVAMVCLVLISLSLGALLQIARAQLQQARRGEDRLQSEWLAESALERAAAQLAEDGAYEGETWEPSPDELGRKQAGRVVIQVEEIPNRESSRRVTVVALFPKAGPRAVQTTRSIEITLD